MKSLNHFYIGIRQLQGREYHKRMPPSEYSPVAALRLSSVVTSTSDKHNLY